MTEDEPKRIAVTMSLYPEEYDLIVKSERCQECGHLECLHHYQNEALVARWGTVCNVDRCECLRP